MTYSPKGNSKNKSSDSIYFQEYEPPEHLSDIVHRYLELRTVIQLKEAYRFHALPDACTYIIFDQIDKNVAGVTRIQASSEELNLGEEFHYINVRLLPGVWQGGKEELSFGMVNSKYLGELPLLETNLRLQDQDPTQIQNVLSSFIEYLIELGLVSPNSTTKKIFENLAEIRSVGEMAEICEISPRQLQRILKKTTGFSPHDFLKILRLQQSLNEDNSLSYADQSHFIRSFRKATGYTPGMFNKKFDV